MSGDRPFASSRPTPAATASSHRSAVTSYRSDRRSGRNSHPSSTVDPVEADCFRCQRPSNWGFGWMRRNSDSRPIRRLDHKSTSHIPYLIDLQAAQLMSHSPKPIHRLVLLHEVFMVLDRAEGRAEIMREISELLIQQLNAIEKPAQQQPLREIEITTKRTLISAARGSIN